MGKPARFWKVVYEKPVTGETIRACVSAKTKKDARSEAIRHAKHTAWRVKSVAEMPQIGEAS